MRYKISVTFVDLDVRYMPKRIIPPPTTVYIDGSWCIQGIAYARREEPIGSPKRNTDATEARIYPRDQLYNVCPKIPDTSAIKNII